MRRLCFVLLCFLVCLTNEVEEALNAASEPQVCTHEKIVSVTSGRSLSLIARVDDDEKCYFVFQAKNESVTKCCYGQDCDSSTNYRKCLPEDQYSVSSEQSSNITKSDICRLDILSVNETNHGLYKMFTRDHQSTPDKDCHVQINPPVPDEQEEEEGEDPKDEPGKGTIGTAGIFGIVLAIVLLLALAIGIPVTIILKKKNQGKLKIPGEEGLPLFPVQGEFVTFFIDIK